MWVCARRRNRNWRALYDRQAGRLGRLHFAVQRIQPLGPSLMLDSNRFLAHAIRRQRHREGDQAARSPHAFLGIDLDGRAAVVNTAGNKAQQLILRGGSTGPNYDDETVAKASNLLEGVGLRPLDADLEASGRQDVGPLDGQLFWEVRHTVVVAEIVY